MSNTNRRVEDTTAGKSISAYVILRKGKIVAKVLVYFGGGRTCVVNVIQHDDPAKKSYKVALAADPKLQVDYPESGLTFQGRVTGGYGYDKFTAALSGVVIDGIALNDHCGIRLPLPKGKKLFPRSFKTPPGYSLVNYVSSDRSTTGRAGYSDCYRQSGIKLLSELGYEVTQVI